MGRWIAVALAWALGCGDSERCAPEVYVETLRVEPVEALDVLFVLDDSEPMAESRAAFAAELPRLLDRLTDGDGWPSSLHLGIVTTDMATGPDGACTEWGDDGLLQAAGDMADGECAATYPAWLTFASGDDVAALGSSLRCLANGGGGEGCMYPQPLEAMLKALTPSTSGITFAGGTVGHGDGENAGFLRPDSLLAVVVLTDRDDCSVIDTELFDPDSPRYDPNLPLRCFDHPEAAQPLSRFVDGLTGLRLARPEQVTVAIVAGVPVDRIPTGDEPFAAAVMDILADDRMIERPDPEDATALVPACESTERGPADPARRLVAFAAGAEPPPSAASPHPSRTPVGRSAARSSSSSTQRAVRSATGRPAPPQEAIPRASAFAAWSSPRKTAAAGASIAPTPTASPSTSPREPSRPRGACFEFAAATPPAEASSVLRESEW